ncbi:MAG: sporulation protein YunB [Clostridia bacterium]|nr:sporulation protein YunB [Clostridia bacterium]MEE1024139.1 sporulation protein YunB [Acutalibacteraceae bacterium]
MRRKRVQILRFRLMVAGILILVCVLCFACSDNTGFLIQKAACDTAKTVVNREINKRMKELVCEVEYSDFVSTVYDNDGNVKSAELNSTEVNKFVAQVNLEIADAVSGYDTGTLKIRIGTFTGNEYMSGKGPYVNLKYSLVCTPATELKDSFVSVGINQTKHSVYLHITTKISVLIPWYDTYTELENSFVIAETIIVGDVPETYLNLENS